MNREAWLHKLADKHLWPRIQKAGGKVCAKYRISCGWPKGSRGGKSGHAIGQCWSPRVSGDGTTEIFVSPSLDSSRALDVLLHELVHASVGNEAGHGPKFKKLAIAVGLTGPMKATVLHEDARAWAKVVLEMMGVYPHAPIREGEAPEKKPGSRLLKAFCAECGYTVRITKQWLDVALPVCPDRDCEGFGRAFEVD